MGPAEKAARIRAREVADEAERARHWAATRAEIDALAPEIAQRCKQRHLKKTRLDGLLARKAWTFEVWADGRPGEGATCMHLGFYPNGKWTLLGCHDGHCTEPVDKMAPFHPGLRQGFVFDTSRHEADVVFRYSGEQIRYAIIGQMRDATNAE